MDRKIAYCGAACTECPAFIATQSDDQEALKQVAAQWSKEFDATITWEYCVCDGCQSFEGRNCGHCSECEVRACGIERKVLNCAHCDEYACEKLERFFGFVPSARATLDELRQSL